ncbi:MAG TPA: hypothetical protein VNT56_01225 [Acidimicrobiales bacterium]|nr:hypothetical protein [Acidimicrobiales bacterium]
MERIETCNSVWLVDRALMQFCRMPKDVDPSGAVSGHWQAYYLWHDDPDSGAFRVALDEAHTRWLSSTRHVDPCSRCGEEATREVVMAPAAPAPPPD